MMKEKGVLFRVTPFLRRANMRGAGLHELICADAMLIE
jgi:hypothetical protein